MRVLVLGSGGMAGHVISLYLREQGFDVDTLSAKHSLDDKTHLIDVRDSAKITQFLDTHHYDVVVNCIATLVQLSDVNKSLAAYLNAYWPHFLEKYYENSQTQIIHLSTDGVFSGNKSPYKENAPYDGQGFYDRSKALGELINTKDLTLRMSIIGPDLDNDSESLFAWFFRQQGDVVGYSRVIWNGVTTLELAKGIAAAINQKISGIYHFSPHENISKLDLLRLIGNIFGKHDVDIKPSGDKEFSRILTNTRKDLNFSISDYNTMIKELKEWIASHRDIYGHYQ